jgi:hypothetical protein
MVWNSIKSGFLGKLQKESKDSLSDKGLVIFNTVEEAIKAEKVIKKAGSDCNLVAPPASLRKGCDLALEINLIEQPSVERFLEGQVFYNGIYPIAGVGELLKIVKITEYEKYTMVKAGNMKIVYAKSDGTIVNTSGGGCPDIPYLNIQMVGKRLSEAPHPKEMGYTLCALMLNRAFEEALNLWKGGQD